MNTQQGLREENGALGNTCLVGYFAEECTAILMCIFKLGISIFFCTENLKIWTCKGQMHG